VRVTVKRAVLRRGVRGHPGGLAPTLRECWAGLDNASRVHPYQPTTHLYAHEAARKAFVGKTLRLTNAEGVDLAVHMRRYEVQLSGFVAMAEIERKRRRR
jgi:hypothetical protein